MKAESKSIEDKIAKYREELKTGKKDPQELEREAEIAVQNFQREHDEKKKEEDLKLKDDIRKIDDQRDEQVHQKQGAFVAQAIILPPIPPLLLAALVFLVRRAKETEGVSKKRLL